MKIEVGESLFYSWLRHVKECHLVQMNWKVSSQWDLLHEPELEILLNVMTEHFQTKYDYNVFKKNSSMSQIIRQGECDVLGIAFGREENKFYAVDVAFHEAGLNYGSKDETIMKVIAKMIRTAICLYGYMDTKTAEIIFASPKINLVIMEPLTSCVSDLNHIFKSQGYEFKVRVIANDLFHEQVLQPILLVSNGIADTSELFVRAYQMYQMFADKKVSKREYGTNETKKISTMNEVTEPVGTNDTFSLEGSHSLSREFYRELKIGKLVQMVLKPLIINKATEQEIKKMQQVEYSKKTFGIQYPLLLKTKQPIAERHYYKDLFDINGETYRLCCEWYETGANNDRPFVEQWIKEHEK